MINSDKFYELSEDVVNKFNEIMSTKSFPFELKILFQGNNKQKTLISVSKIPDKYAFATGKELMVSINEDLYDRFDDESIEILISQEIDKISVNGMNGKIKMNKPDLTTFSGIVNKYGIEKVARANEVEDICSSSDSDVPQKDTFIA